MKKKHFAKYENPEEKNSKRASNTVDLQFGATRGPEKLEVWLQGNGLDLKVFHLKSPFLICRTWAYIFTGKEFGIETITLYEPPIKQKTSIFN